MNLSCNCFPLLFSVPVNAPQRVFDARKCENDAPLSSFLRPWDARKNQFTCGQGRWREDWRQDNVTPYPWSNAHSNVFHSRGMLASVPCSLFLGAIVIDILFLLFHWQKCGNELSVKCLWDERVSIRGQRSQSRIAKITRRRRLNNMPVLLLQHSHFLRKQIF